MIGALNLFHAEAGERHETDIDAAQALADIATIAILQHRATLKAQVVNQLRQHALNSRIVIEQAKGVVAERQASTSSRRSRPCATMPATKTFAWSSSLRMSSAATWSQRHWTVRLRR